jgi:hypothetical protein
VLGFNLIWLTDGKSDPAELGTIIDTMLKPSVRWKPAVIGRAFDFTQAREALRFFKRNEPVPPPSCLHWAPRTLPVVRLWPILVHCASPYWLTAGASRSCSGKSVGKIVLTVDQAEQGRN